MKQSERILNHLQNVGTITSKEAMDRYGIMRLASRINDLRNDGYDIGGEMVTVKNRYGESCTIKEYRLNKAEEGQYLLV